MKVIPIRRAAATAVLALAALLPALAGSAPAPAPKSAAKPAAPAKSPAAAKKAPAGALPDTVLARVTPADGKGKPRDITRRQMMTTAARAGQRLESITPKERREFLDVLVDQVVLVARVQQEPRNWEHRDSLEYTTLRDRLVLRAALDSAMVEVNAERLAKGDTLLPPQEVGVILRDRTVAKLAPTWNEPALVKAVSVFDTLPRPTSGMSMVEQMRVAGLKPTVSEEEGRMVLAQSGAGAYTLGDLVRDFGKLNPIYRPRVSTVENVKEMVSNVLFENVLRKAAEDRGLERRPDVARQLSDRAEYLDVSRFVAREVYARIPMDSVTLKRYFTENQSDFDVDERAHVVRMVFPDRAEADAMVKRLQTPNEAESLAAQSARAGVPYSTVVAREGDTLLFARMKHGGVGTVLGPDSTRQGWRTLRVMQLEPRRPRTYAQAEGMVKERWYGVEGERIMRALLDDLRKHAVVVVNEHALAKPLPAAGAGGAK
jgi:hypothetical protein